MSELAAVLDRLGGVRRLVDGRCRPPLFAATNAVTLPSVTATGRAPVHGCRCGGSAVALDVLWIPGAALAGLLRGLMVLAAAAGLALWPAGPRTSSLRHLRGHGVRRVCLAVSALVGYPVVGYAYGLLFPTGTAWRRDPRLRRVLTLATWDWAATYAVRAGTQVASCQADEPALLAMVKAGARLAADGSRGRRSYPSFIPSGQFRAARRHHDSGGDSSAKGPGQPFAAPSS
jgi:hypothetical protein